MSKYSTTALVAKLAFSLKNLSTDVTIKKPMFLYVEERPLSYQSGH